MTSMKMKLKVKIFLVTISLSKFLIAFCFLLFISFYFIVYIYLYINYFCKCSDYRRMDEHDQYESVGLDESHEDERDLDQIMADRRAAEIELDARDGVASQRKLPQLLHDQGQLGFYFSAVLYFLFLPLVIQMFVLIIYCMCFVNLPNYIIRFIGRLHFLLFMHMKFSIVFRCFLRLPWTSGYVKQSCLVH